MQARQSHSPQDLFLAAKTNGGTLKSASFHTNPQFVITVKDVAPDDHCFVYMLLQQVCAVTLAWLVAPHPRNVLPMLQEARCSGASSSKGTFLVPKPQGPIEPYVGVAVYSFTNW